MRYLTAQEVLYIHYRVLVETGGAFGVRDLAALQAAIGRPQATYGGEDLYPDVFSRAAALLESLVLGHPFVDGNKRIAAALFLWFMQKNALLRREDGTKRIADNALVAMTLLIAVSLPAEKQVINALVVNMINNRN